MGESKIKSKLKNSSAFFESFVHWGKFWTIPAYKKKLLDSVTIIAIAYLYGVFVYTAISIDQLTPPIVGAGQLGKGRQLLTRLVVHILN